MFYFIIALFPILMNPDDFDLTGRIDELLVEFEHPSSKKSEEGFTYICQVLLLLKDYGNEHPQFANL